VSAIVKKFVIQKQDHFTWMLWNYDSLISTAYIVSILPKF